MKIDLSGLLPERIGRVKMFVMRQREIQAREILKEKDRQIRRECRKNYRNPLTENGVLPQSATIMPRSVLIHAFEYLLIYRRRNNLSLKTMGRLCGVSGNVYRNYEFRMAARIRVGRTGEIILYVIEKRLFLLAAACKAVEELKNETKNNKA